MAVVKAGAFGIVRVVYDVYGIEFAADLGSAADDIAASIRSSTAPCWRCVRQPEETPGLLGGQPGLYRARLPRSSGR